MSRQELIKRIGISFFLTLMFVVFAYEWVDRPVVTWLAAHHSHTWSWVEFLHLWGESAGAILAYFALPFYIYLGMRLLFSSELTTPEKHFFILANMLTVGYYAVIQPLKILCGRAWPATWINHNLSYLDNGYYGFHFALYNSGGYNSFPSGHAFISSALFFFSYYFFPRFKYLFLLYAVVVVGMMIVQYYHFVSDNIAGVGLAYIITTFTYYYYQQQERM